MQTKNNKLFRQEALERLSSPERLDQMIQVVSPRAWLPLSAIGFLVATAGVWSVVGRIPLNVTGQGVLIQPRQVVQFQSPSAGGLLNLKIKVGDIVKRDQVIATIDQSTTKQQLEQEKAKLAELERQKIDTNKLQKQQISQELNTLQKQQQDLQESLRRESISPLLRQQTLTALRQKRQSLEESLRRESIAPLLRQQTLNALTQKRETLKESLRRDSIVPLLRQQTLTVIEEKRQNLKQQKQEVSSLIKTLQQRVEAHRSLFEEKIITQEQLLQVQQEYMKSQLQVSDIETQLKELDVQKTTNEREYMQNLNRINEIKNNIQEIDIQATNAEREYQQNLTKVNEIKNNIQQVEIEKTTAEREHLQNLNKIDEITTKIKDLKNQETKLAQQDLEKTVNQTNQIQEIKRKIAQLEKKLTGESKIVSQYDGKILEISVAPGQILTAGMRLGAIEAEDPRAKIVSVVYFADKDGKQIKPGMSVQVTPSVVKRERYGGIIGKVTRVSPFPVTNQEMSAIIGNENLANNLSESLKAGGGAPVQIFAELEEDSTNTSGYKWSSSKGPALKITSGTTASVRVQIAEQAPISYVIPIFKSLTGVN
ncbi:NHLP bacteriocin system secretion protein [Microcoleus sp. herbarium19]|uniref:NHLP bacteriocin system secretion protein n=1 Tax=unclassified Microcoleus TaxID=2642155 RepID=UPI002FD77E78